MSLATEGQFVQTLEVVFKNLVASEFPRLQERHRLEDTKLEEVHISKLQQFLLELGKRFAFARQERRS